MRLASAYGIALALTCAVLFAGATALEPRALHSDGLASKKGHDGPRDAGGEQSEEGEEPAPPAPLLGTLAQTHTGERVPIDSANPPQSRFDALLADRVTGATHSLDPRLLALLRTLASEPAFASGGPPRIELVSGFRSPKLNEMLRKKGHHVASHSQHSLGHAVDFRIVVPNAPRDTRGEAEARDKHDKRDERDKPEAAQDARARDAATAVDPRVLERAIRASGWDGGVGVYTSKDDWFVHADVGPRRRWTEGPP